MFWTIVATIIVCLLLYYTTLDLYLIYVRGLPPGPLSLPLIGGLHHLSPKQPQFSLEKLVKDYGKILSLRMGPIGRVVFLQDIGHITRIMDCSESNDRPPLPFIDILNMINNKRGSGLGSVRYGDKWKTLTHTFQRGMARLSHDSFSIHINNVFSQLFDRFTDQHEHEYNPRPDVIKACSSIFSSLVYGRSYTSLDDADLQSRIKYHSHIMVALHPAHPVNLFPWLWNIPMSWKTTVQNCLKERDITLHGSFQRHCQEFTGEINDLMDVTTDYMTNKDKDDITLEDMLISTWATYTAGCETITDTMLWTVLYLAMDPNVQAHVQAEVDKFVPRDRQPHSGDKENLNYTRAVLLEALRRSSTNPTGIPRYTTADIELGDYTIPKGTMVMVNHWHVHHSTSYWDDPFTFKPDRFLDEDGKILSPKIIKKMAFIPFSRGKRCCLGQFMAQDILMLFIAGLMQQFSLRLPEGFTPDMGGRLVFSLRACDFQTIITPRWKH